MSSTPHNAEQRVLALVTDAFGGYGGMAQYNRDFIGALAVVPEVQQVVVLPRQADDVCESLPPRVTQLAPVKSRPAYIAAALREARRVRPTVVFCGHLYHGPLAVAVARATGARLVSQVHGTEIWGPLRQLQRAALERSDMILTVSRDTRARVLAAVRVEPEQVPVLNNTVGDDYTPGDRAAARARFGFGTEFVVLTVARLDPRDGYKGHDLIIPQIARLAAQGLDLCYVICGTGRDHARLESIAARHGVADRVRFLGMVARTDLPDLYRATDLFALPSSGEGFGIAFIEAMACGTPAVGLAVGGAPDALGDGELGACCAASDFAATFERLVRTGSGDREKLAGAVRGRFQRATFERRVAQLMQRLMVTPQSARVNTRGIS